MNPVLSIIVPVYKVEVYLEDCINSILKQSFRDFELILVDDGSPDRCGEICNRYAKIDSRIRVIHKTNGGLSSARNAGINESMGKYITFVDSDDTLSEETYAPNMEIILSDPSIDLLEYPVHVFFQSSRQFILKNKEHHVYGKEEIFNYWIRIDGYRHAYACNKIYKRNLFSHIRFPENKTFEDIYTTPLLLRQANHLYMSPHGMYIYYSRPTSITLNASYSDHLCLLDANIKVIELTAEYPKLKKELSILYLYTVDIFINLLRYKNGDKKTNKVMSGHMKKVNINLFELLTLNIPIRTKFKNLTLALLGLKAHSTLYTVFFKTLK